MPSFSDANGTTWEVRLDAPTILAVRDECDPKFLQDSESENTFSRIAGDPVLLCRVIYVLCKRQRESRGIGEADFYALLAGDVIDAATSALVDAIVSFTPRRSRELLEVSARKTEKIRQIATERALARIKDPALEAKLLDVLDSEIERLLGGTITSRPATGSPAS